MWYRITTQWSGCKTAKGFCPVLYLQQFTWNHRQTHVMYRKKTTTLFCHLYHNSGNIGSPQTFLTISNPTDFCIQYVLYSIYTQSDLSKTHIPRTLPSISISSLCCSLTVIGHDNIPLCCACTHYNTVLSYSMWHSTLTRDEGDGNDSFGFFLAVVEMHSNDGDHISPHAITALMLLLPRFFTVPIELRNKYVLIFDFDFPFTSQDQPNFSNVPHCPNTSSYSVVVLVKYNNTITVFHRNKCIRAYVYSYEICYCTE